MFLHISWADFVRTVETQGVSGLKLNSGYPPAFLKVRSQRSSCAQAHGPSLVLLLDSNSNPRVLAKIVAKTLVVKNSRNEVTMRILYTLLNF